MTWAILLVIKEDGNDAIVKAVLLKYVGEAGGNNGSEAVVAQSPRVHVPETNRSRSCGRQPECGAFLVAGDVENEVRVRASILVETPGGKEKLSQIPCRSMLFRYTAGIIWSVSTLAPLQRGDYGVQFHKRFHSSPLNLSKCLARCFGCSVSKPGNIASPDTVAGFCRTSTAVPGL